MRLFPTTRGLAGAVSIAALALGLYTSTASAALLFTQLPGELGVTRYAPAAATLPNGKVLIAGGYEETSHYLKSAELFNPATGTFEALTAPGQEMSIGREEIASATLPDGRVLLAGGWNGSALKTAELYNPATGAFEAALSELPAPRTGAAAVLLPDGEVLIVGGYDGSKDTATSMLFDPTTQTFTTVPGEMSTSRYAPAAALLPDGNVLIAGGYGEASKKYLASAELFDPSTQTYEKLEGSGHELNQGRAETGFTRMQNGEILIVGGYDNIALKSTEVFNPETNTFEKSPPVPVSSRDFDATALLPDGQALTVGGYDEHGTYLTTTETTSLTAPSATSAVASATSANGATLNGTAQAETVSTAYFQYGTSPAYGLSTAQQSVGATIKAPQSLSAGVSGLSAGTTYHFRIVAQNGGGANYGADETFTTASTPAPPPPRIAGFTQSHRLWREGSALASVSRRRRPPLGTTFLVSLNEPASISLVFTTKVGGRKIHHKCLAQTNHNRHKPACTRTITAGRLSLVAHAGVNKVSFQGRLSRAIKLRPGTYTVTVIATSAARLHSNAKKVSFTIVK
jgi:hypothetical protein